MVELVARMEWRQIIDQGKVSWGCFEHGLYKTDQIYLLCEYERALMTDHTSPDTAMKESLRNEH